MREAEMEDLFVAFMGVGP